LVNEIKEFQMYQRKQYSFTVDPDVERSLEFLLHLTDADLFKLSWRTQLSALLSSEHKRELEESTIYFNSNPPNRNQKSCSCHQKLEPLIAFEGPTVNTEYDEKARILIRSSVTMEQRSLSWKKKKEVDKVKLFVEKGKSLLTKYETTLNCTVEHAFSHLSVKSLCALDPSIKMEVIDQVTDDLVVVRIEPNMKKYMKFVKQRDLVLLRYQEILKDQGYAIVTACSVQRSDVPERKGYIRADTYSLYVLKDVGEGKCSISYIVTADPKGNLGPLTKIMQKKLISDRRNAFQKLKTQIESAPRK